MKKNITELERRRSIFELGQMVIEHYVSSGTCMFCKANDVEFEPHEDHCDVGDISGIKQTPERAQKIKEKQYLIDELLHEFVVNRLDK